MDDRDEVTSEYQCPWCLAWIPAEYMNTKTIMTTIGPSPILLCVTCGTRYEEDIVTKMRERMDAQSADGLGISVEALRDLRAESEYYSRLDEERVDDEVYVMDAGKAKKVFRDNRDPFEQRKTPIQVMTERFMRGVAQSREKRIIVPQRNRIKKYLKKR